MKGLMYAAAAALLSLLLVSAGEVIKPPAQFKGSGEFSGGAAGQPMVINGIRFGNNDGVIRMVLDFENCDAQMGSRSSANRHPIYSITLREYPYHLAIRFNGVMFDPKAKVQSDPALPFSIVTQEDGTVKEIQVFLAGPVEFKVIEIDDPAKLSIDVKVRKGAPIPNVFTVQLTEPKTAEEAFALVEQGTFPEGFAPEALVLGSLIVVEQAFTDPAMAAQMDTQLRAMGYSTMINERKGNELPAR
jgi:hypothetical protein